MTRSRIFYWTLTGLVALPMAASGVLYLMGVSQGAGEVIDTFARLGYPAYLPALLGVAKLLGALALVVQRFPVLTEWAYAGFTFDFIGAAVSHLAVGDGIAGAGPPLVLLAILLGSYALWRRRRRAVAPSGAPPESAQR